MGCFPNVMMHASYLIRKWEGHFLLEKRLLDSFRNICAMYLHDCGSPVNATVVIATAKS